VERQNAQDRRFFKNRPGIGKDVMLLRAYQTVTEIKLPVEKPDPNLN
jgi:hypothetical protein